MSLSVAWHPFIRCKKARFGQSSTETRYAKKLPILGAFWSEYGFIQLAVDAVCQVLG